MKKASVLLSDPEVISIAIVENNEPLVDLKRLSIIAYGPSPEIPNNTDYTKVRKTVYEKLVFAQSLLPTGLKLCLYEGYRSIALQRMLFENRFSKLQTLYPAWPHERVFHETTRLVAPVINSDGSKNIPPHSTGSAVDVYLINDDSQPVDMGILVQNWMDDIDGSRSQTLSKRISGEAQRYREIMSEALLAAGFINFPNEYWHWSFGDRYWAHQSDQPHAIYGSIE